MLDRAKERHQFKRDYIELRLEMREQMALGLPYLTSAMMSHASKKCLENQTLYYQIEKTTKVWWPIVGWFHYYFLNYRLDTFDHNILGVIPDRISKSLANSSYPAPDTFEDSITDALKQSFRLKDWLRGRSFEQILSSVSIALLRSSSSVYKVSDMMTLGTYQNQIPSDMKYRVRVGFIPFLNYLVDNKLIDTASKDISLPVGFSNIIDRDSGIKS
jgi:hypothetical protein